MSLRPTPLQAAANHRLFSSLSFAEKTSTSVHSMKRFLKEWIDWSFTRLILCWSLLPSLHPVSSFICIPDEMNSFSFFVRIKKLNNRSSIPVEEQEYLGFHPSLFDYYDNDVRLIIYDDYVLFYHFYLQMMSDETFLVQLTRLTGNTTDIKGFLASLARESVGRTYTMFFGQFFPTLFYSSKDKETLMNESSQHYFCLSSHQMIFPGE